MYFIYVFITIKIEASESTSSLTESMTSTTSAPPLLAPGEIIKPSGKFSKPTRIPGKNYCKDEVVIRNADSGKGLNLCFIFTLLPFFYILNTSNAEPIRNHNLK